MVYCLALFLWFMEVYHGCFNTKKCVSIQIYRIMLSSLFLSLSLSLSLPLSLLLSLSFSHSLSYSHSHSLFLSLILSLFLIPSLFSLLLQWLLCLQKIDSLAGRCFSMRARCGLFLKKTGTLNRALVLFMKLIPDLVKQRWAKREERREENKMEEMWRGKKLSEGWWREEWRRMEENRVE